MKTKFEDLSKLSNEDIILAIDVIQRMVARRERTAKDLEMVRQDIDKKREVRNLRKTITDIEGELKLKTKQPKVDISNIKAKQEELRDIQRRISQIEAEIENDRLKREAKKEAPQTYQKYSDKEKELMIIYAQMDDNSLKEEGKRIFLFSQIRPDFEEAKQTISDHERAEDLPHEKEKLLKYFDEYEKGVHKDKAEYLEKCARYGEIVREESKLEARKDKMKAQGLDEETMYRQAKANLAFFDDMENWDKIMNDIQVMQEQESQTIVKKESDEKSVDYENEMYDEEPITQIIEEPKSLIERRPRIFEIIKGKVKGFFGFFKETIDNMKNQDKTQENFQRKQQEAIEKFQFEKKMREAEERRIAYYENERKDREHKAREAAGKAADTREARKSQKPIRQNIITYRTDGATQKYGERIVRQDTRANQTRIAGQAKNEQAGRDKEVARNDARTDNRKEYIKRREALAQEKAELEAYFEKCEKTGNYGDRKEYASKKDRYNQLLRVEKALNPKKASAQTAQNQAESEFKGKRQEFMKRTDARGQMNPPKTEIRSGNEGKSDRGNSAR